MMGDAPQDPALTELLGEAPPQPRKRKKPRPQVYRHDVPAVTAIALSPEVPQTSALIEEILEWLCRGRTLSSYCRLPDRPDRRTVTRWVAMDPVLQRRFQEARRIGHEVLHEDILELADAPLERDAKGRYDPSAVNLRRLQVDARLRCLSNWDYVRYGGAGKIQVSGDPDNPLVMNHALTADVREQRIRALIGKATVPTATPLGNGSTTNGSGSNGHHAIAHDAEHTIAPPEAPPPVPIDTEPATDEQWIAAAQARWTASPDTHERDAPKIVGVAFGLDDVVAAVRSGDRIDSLHRRDQGGDVIDWLGDITRANSASLVVAAETGPGRRLIRELRDRKVSVTTEVFAENEIQRLKSSKLSLPVNDLVHRRVALLAIAATLTAVQVVQPPPSYWDRPQRVVREEHNPYA
jgi:hypothetical protein